MNRITVETKPKKNSAYRGISPILDPQARLAALRQLRGVWKNRKPDPIKVLAKIRKEWERKLPK